MSEKNYRGRLGQFQQRPAGDPDLLGGPVRFLQLPPTRGQLEVQSADGRRLNPDDTTVHKISAQ
ncbi:hypothetical protein [Streptomyces hokutonensis]|uniref:hypothetical protein n=1 Tax=Streptomyces hokutonensis TaxID=1306990 RepID=UPI0033D5D1D0